MSLLDRLRGRPPITPEPEPAPAPEPPAPVRRDTATTVARAVDPGPQAWRGLGPTALVTATPPSVADPRNGAGHALEWQQPPPRLTHAGAGGPTGLVSGMATVLQGGLGMLAAAAAPGPEPEPQDLTLAVPQATADEIPGAAPPAEAPAPLRRLAAVPTPEPEPVPAAAATPAAPGAPPSPATPPPPAATEPPPAARPADVPVGMDGPGLRLVRRPARATPAEAPRVGEPPTPDELALPLATPPSEEPAAAATARGFAPAADRTPLDPRPLPAVTLPPQIVQVPGPVVEVPVATPPAATRGADEEPGRPLAQPPAATTEVPSPTPAAPAAPEPALPLALRPAAAAEEPDRPLLGASPLALPPALQLSALPQPTGVEASAAGLALLAPLAVVEPGRPRAAAAAAQDRGVTDLLTAPLPSGAGDSGPALARAVGQTLEPAPVRAIPTASPEPTSLLGRLFRGTPPEVPAERPRAGAVEDAAPAVSAGVALPGLPLAEPLAATATGGLPDLLSPAAAGAAASTAADAAAPALRLLPSVPPPAPGSLPAPGHETAATSGGPAGVRGLTELVRGPGPALPGQAPETPGFPSALPYGAPDLGAVSGGAQAQALALAEPGFAAARPMLSAVGDAFPLARPALALAADSTDPAAPGRPDAAAPLSGPALLAAGLAQAEAEVDAVRPPDAAPDDASGAAPGAPVTVSASAAPPAPAMPSVGAMADEIYQEVRSRLRDELLLARERSATLADL